ncbi:hypothetical protein [Bacillus haynesii]|nr:hypothetical protein [Bacillus haynesii]
MKKGEAGAGFHKDMPEVWADALAMNVKVYQHAKEGAIYAPSVIHEYEVV